MIRPFQPSDQSAVQALILTGLAERWGTLDPTLNPDLHDIHSSYIASGGAFFVIEEAGVIIGTGALIPEGPGVGRIVRVSVSAKQRGHGLGRAITEQLIAEGQRRGYHTLLVETNDDWYSALHLYQSCGFIPYDHRDGDVHMKMVI
ncbi:MAG: GNAT family N-acetyltransferase [Ardenticatenaceae bacterium]|nr:GNAT family N-acetyltransferase [Ardenticatenaceae bacterium]MCB9004993.1 GNAT family N-acetyltransferase [Ardenticatenaceae bacterium]